MVFVRGFIMEKSKLKKIKKAKLKLEKNGTILADESEVGYIEFEVDKKKDKEFIINCFEKTDNELRGIVKQVRMPKEFTFIWVNKIYVKQSKRGKGFGSDILKLLEKRARQTNLVVGLSPGILVKTSNMNKLLPFYKNNGFKVFESKEHYYAFKVLKRC